MNTNVRVTLTDEQKKQFKDVFGEGASRANIKMRLLILFWSAMGEDKPKSMALKTVNLSEAAKDKLRKKLGLDGGKKKMVLKK